MPCHGHGPGSLTSHSVQVVRGTTESHIRLAHAWVSLSCFVADMTALGSLLLFVLGTVRGWCRCRRCRRLLWRRRWYEDTARRSVLQHRPQRFGCLFGLGLGRLRRLLILHGVHGRLEHVRLDRDENVAQLYHAVLWRVVRVLDDDTLALDRLRPVLLEEAVADPFQSRPLYGLGQNAAAMVMEVLAQGHHRGASTARSQRRTFLAPTETRCSAGPPAEAPRRSAGPSQLESRSATAVWGVLPAAVVVLASRTPAVVSGRASLRPALPSRLREPGAFASPPSSRMVTGRRVDAENGRDCHWRLRLTSKFMRNHGSGCWGGISWIDTWREPHVES